MTVAEHSCLPRTVGSEWVALSEAAAAIATPDAPAKAVRGATTLRRTRDGCLLRRPCRRRIQRATNQVKDGFT